MKSERQFSASIRNRRHTVLRTSISRNTSRRPGAKTFPGFTARYQLDKLVFYEAAPDAHSAIAREKQIKGGSRRDKLALIARLNPGWQDLYPAPPSPPATPLPPTH